MNDDPVDLSPLDPTRDRARFDTLVGSIARDAMRARAGNVIRRSDIFAELARWSRPALFAAGIVLAVAIPALVYSRAQGARSVQRVSAADVMGIPRELTALMRATEVPSLSDLRAALASADGR